MTYDRVFKALRDNGFWHTSCDEQRLVNHLRCQGRLTLEEHERLWWALDRSTTASKQQNDQSHGEDVDC